MPEDSLVGSPSTDGEIDPRVTGGIFGLRMGRSVDRIPGAGCHRHLGVGSGTLECEEADEQHDGCAHDSGDPSVHHGGV